MRCEKAGSKHRVAQIRNADEETHPTTTKEKLQANALPNWQACCWLSSVGGMSEVEVKERKRPRDDHALNATRAAVQEGYRCW